ncbi:hypothetical protein [Chryseolinea soli]|uniref:Uncharacterized protein n=1 Tax=Chryseolinea soli TaxID=2321403 RepID=A0A385SEG3_9BACT|nr:hypothetical protein [Chryseolinea soli]AYB29334.1 hypothetical protein D4L85_01485 [Chryseolinea soli]
MESPSDDSSDPKKYWEDDFEGLGIDKIVKFFRTIIFYFYPKENQDPEIWYKIRDHSYSGISKPMTFITLAFALALLTITLGEDGFKLEGFLKLDVPKESYLIVLGMVFLGVVPYGFILNKFLRDKNVKPIETIKVCAYNVGGVFVLLSILLFSRLLLNKHWALDLLISLHAIYLAIMLLSQFFMSARIVHDRSLSDPPWAVILSFIAYYVSFYLVIFLWAGLILLKNYLF